MLKKNPGLIIIALVDEIILVVGAGEAVIHSHLRMARADCVLIKQVASALIR